MTEAGGTPPAGQPPEASLVRSAALAGSRLVFGGVAFATILGFFASWSTLAEIFTHFRAVYLWAAIFAAVVAIFLRQWRLTVLCAVLITWLLVEFVPWYTTPALSAPGAGIELKVLTANVSAHNSKHDPMLDLIARERPDLVFIQELSPQWAAALKDTYPYHVESERKDFLGLGFYSRFPIENAVDEDPVGLDVPLMRADVVIEGRRVHVINVHLLPPEGTTMTRMRKAQYPWLTDYVAERDGALILAGDFNCTMWSPLYKRLVDQGKLVNAREGRGIMPTWLPLGGSLYLLPLDHVFTRGIPIAAARLTERIGSDHSPLIAELRLPRKDG